MISLLNKIIESNGLHVALKKMSQEHTEAAKQIYQIKSLAGMERILHSKNAEDIEPNTNCLDDAQYNFKSIQVLENRQWMNL